MAQYICTRLCGFRVHDRYWLDNPHFTPAICPNDGGPIQIVADYTDEPITDMAVDVDPGSATFRRLIDDRTSVSGGRNRGRRVRPDSGDNVENVEPAP